MRGRGEDEAQDSYRPTGRGLSRKRPERLPRSQECPCAALLAFEVSEHLGPCRTAPGSLSWPLATVLLRSLPHTYLVSEAGHAGSPQATVGGGGARVLNTHHQPALGGTGSSHSETWPWKVCTAKCRSLSCLFLLGKAVLVIFPPPLRKPHGFALGQWDRVWRPGWGTFSSVFSPSAPGQQPDAFPVDTEAVAGLTPTLTEADLDSKWAPGDSYSVLAFGTQPCFHCQTLSPVSCFYC